MASPPRRRVPSPSPRTPPSSSTSFSLEAEIVVVSAKHLKNVNWRHGDLKPYAVLYLEPDQRVATKADDSGSVRPVWNERFILPVPSDDALLTLEIFHSKPSETPKPLIGTARSFLRDLVVHFPGANTSSASVGDSSDGADPVPIRTLELRRPSGRPQGKVRVRISVREVAPPPSPLPPSVPPDYRVPPPSSYYYSSAPPPPSHLLRQPHPSVRDYRSYASPPLPSYANPPPPPPTSQYSYSGYSDPYAGYYSTAGYYSAPPVPAPSRPYYDSNSLYSGPSAPVGYSSGVSSRDPKSRGGSKMGLGAGLAVGAVAGALGGMALEEGLKYKEDKIAERVESDLTTRDDYSDYRGDY